MLAKQYQNNSKQQSITGENKLKYALITGGSAGIGKEAARGLAQQGYQVIIAARDEKKGQKIVNEIKLSIPSAVVDFYSVDMADFDSVRSLATKVRLRWPQLDALVLNAGLFTPKLTTAKSGHEQMFATTHLGHFLLSHELFSLLKNSHDPRIVVTSSMAHRFGSWVDFFNLTQPSGSTALMAVPFLNYGKSKLANLLFVREFDRRYRGSGIKANAFHPGSVKTEIWRSTPKLFNSVIDPFLVTEAEGAQTLLYLACSSEVRGGGEYWFRKKIIKSSKAGRNVELAKQLWRYSEDALNIKEFGRLETEERPSVRA